MSLYIEEMTLPHEDVEPLHLELYADGTVFFMKAPDDCYEFKAFSVPPHGDLIDRDAYAYPGDLIDEPVIIPAEEE